MHSIHTTMNIICRVNADGGLHVDIVAMAVMMVNVSVVEAVAVM